jgi:hypothetical protein
MTVYCDYCKQPAVLVTGSDIYPHRKDLHYGMYWQCKKCSAYVGVHRNSNNKPLGRLANAELREAKQEAHKAFDPIWKEGQLTRSQAYRWLYYQLRDQYNIKKKNCHIGTFDVEACTRTVAICSSRLKAKGHCCEGT